MIEVTLVRHLPYKDKATKSISMPYGPFVGLVIATGTEQDGQFIVHGVRYDGERTRLFEEPDPFYPGPEFYNEPSVEWIQEQNDENEKNRVQRIKEYESAGWCVERSEEKTSISFSYREA